MEESVVTLIVNFYFGQVTVKQHLTFTVAVFSTTNNYNLIGVRVTVVTAAIAVVTATVAVVTAAVTVVTAAVTVVRATVTVVTAAVTVVRVR